MKEFKFCSTELSRLKDNEIYLKSTAQNAADEINGCVPTYLFDIYLASSDERVGEIALRVGYSRNTFLEGNIGYEVFLPYRGNHYALKACKLLLELAKHHNMHYLTITCRPDNKPSRRTCELLGANLLVHKDNPKENCIYELFLSQDGIYGSCNMLGLSRKVCVSNEEVSLIFANICDVKLIYEMDAEEESIYNSIYYGECEKSTWESSKNSDLEFYTGDMSYNNYLLIKYRDYIVGNISHTHNRAKIDSMEIDITIRSEEYTGRGIGSESIRLLTDYLNEEYDIMAFIIRPGRKNTRAIRAYEKCGFRIVNSFDSDIYGELGEGDYGIEGTLNMIKEY